MTDPAAGLDSGAAFVLADPPREPVSVTLDGGAQVEARPEHERVVVRFSGADSAEAAWTTGHERAQEGLDMMSILGNADLVTRRTAEEFVVSWPEDGEQILRVVETVVWPFTVNPPTLVVKDKNGNVVPANRPIPRHHPAFRYFRLSQVTEDLYDAYRNMYLAFELLLSSQYPKQRREREIDWLERALAPVCAELELGKTLRSPSTDLPADIIETVYKRARLPLFHAKQGREVFAPHESEDDRRRVSEALAQLTRIVLEMARAWYDARRMGGGVFHAWVHNNIEGVMRASELLACSERVDDPKLVDLDHPSFAAAIRMETTVEPADGGRRAPVLCGRAPASAFVSNPQVMTFVVARDGDPAMVIYYDQPLHCEGVDEVQLHVRQRVVNTRQPRERFER